MFELFRRRSREKNFGPHRIHYLHIGKTAGNQIKYVLRAALEANEGVHFQLHPHSTRLEKLHPDAQYFFSIRHPVTRFKAAFYERKRQDYGKNPWSADEKESFSVFEHAVDLAEALFEDSDKGVAARNSLWSIEHMRKPQSSWFVPIGHFLRRRPPVWIIRQESLDHDLDALFQRLGVSQGIKARAGSKRAKITSYHGIPDLTEKAEANLARWYSADVKFYEDCSNWLDTNG